jgi:hypothetical protein
MHSGNPAAREIGHWAKAKTLALTIAPSVLAIADAVID